jgi:hypothetical protein
MNNPPKLATVATILAMTLAINGVAQSEQHTQANAVSDSPASPNSQTGGDNKTPKAPLSANEQQARKLLDEAKAKILSINSLIVDIEQPKRCGIGPSKNFEKTGQIVLQRPNKFKVERLVGTVVRKPKLLSLSDGERAIRFDDNDFVAYEKPVRSNSFFMGHNFMVQYFFDPKPIRFDPTDPVWEKSVSQFDRNATAYDRDVRTAYLGKLVLEDIEYDVVEIKYNTAEVDIRQQVYLDSDRMVAQVDTYYDKTTWYEKYRNYQPESGGVTASAFKFTRPDKMPIVETDPARLGEVAPEFKLPGAKGEPSVTLKELLTKGKGVLVCSLSATSGKAQGPDYWLTQMRLLQEIKNRFESQGLQVVVIFGGSYLTPDVKNEMLMNWVPDLTRFNYPIAIDIDVERGIQGAAYENMQVNGRRTLLLDKEGKVVFACNRFDDWTNGKPNMLALYQAMGQIGFSVSQADLESASRF